MHDAAAAPALHFHDVEKLYGALRPLRVKDLRIHASSCTSLIGFDQPAAEAFVNLATGATLPDQGGVSCLGQSTATIQDSDAWLRLVERIGIVSHRIVLLEAMTVAQNLAISFDLALDPIPAEVLPRVRTLAGEVNIAASVLETAVAEVDVKIRASVTLARALALDPELLLLEHATTALPADASAAYAAMLKTIWQRRGLTLVALTADERFGRALGGSALRWDPATGALGQPRRTRFLGLG